MRKFDPSTLFEAWRRDPRLLVYRTVTADLDAVRAGKKGMSVFDLEDHRELMPLAFERELVLVLHDDEHVFVARPEELWRIPACLALWKTAFEDGTWSNAAEAQMSLLLGYTEAQRKRWLAWQRYQHAAWGCPTVYAILTTAQRRAVLAMDRRGLGPGVSPFSSDRRVLKSAAVKLIPKGLTLARVARDRDGALASNVQFLTRSGWV